MNVHVFISCLFLLPNLVLGANILLVSALVSPSHHIFNKALGIELSKKGHNVTMVGYDVEKFNSKSFNYIQMEGVYEHVYTGLDLSDWIKMNAFQGVIEMYVLGDAICYGSFKSNGFKQLMNYPKDHKFDMIIYDITLAPCMYGLADRFGKPLTVGLTAFLLPPYFVEPMGGHIYPSYYPYYGLQCTEKMNFFERMWSFVLTRFDIFYRYFIFPASQNKLIKEHFGESAKTMQEYEQDLEILLSNTDPILDFPISLPPNIIPVGGMHLKESNKLPADLEKIVENAKDGFILFSLGTNIKSSSFDENLRKELLAAFAKLKQVVIWKFEEEFKNLPKNVVVRKWLPQNDLLGHKNCKLFITHAGALSTQETMFHGVPIVGIPGFLDQHRNVKKLVEKGLGLQLSFDNLKRDVVYETLQEVLTNPKYMNNIKKLSAQYRDQPQKPMDRAVFWIEYVLKHNGAKELELPARHMYFYQTTSLDVITFLILLITLPIYALYKIFKNTCKKTQKKIKKQ